MPEAVAAVVLALLIELDRALELVLLSLGGMAELLLNGREVLPPIVDTLPELLGITMPAPLLLPIPLLLFSGETEEAADESDNGSGSELLVMSSTEPFGLRDRPPPMRFIPRSAFPPAYTVPFLS